MKNTGDDAVQIHNVKTLKNKLKSLQKDIKLDNDEITMIIYTSIDHEFLTNLLIMQGEFLLWFNLNFEGESREEVDFL